MENWCPRNTRTTRRKKSARLEFWVFGLFRYKNTHQLTRLSVQKQGQRSALSPAIHFATFSGMRLALAALDQGLLLELVSSLVPMAGLHLGRTDINATIHHPLKTRTTLIHSQCWITPVDCRAIRCRQMGEGETAVILQRSEPGIRVDPIASGR